MKTLKSCFLLVLSLALLSCGNAINSAGEEKDEAAQSAAMAALGQSASDTATYRYLGYMYDESSGKDLNDSVFTGEVFERYEVQIQCAMNLMLGFPTSILENVEGMTEEEAEGMAYSDWWRTLPEQVKSEINRIGKGAPEGMTEALRNYYSSGAEDEAIDYYIKGIDVSAEDFPARLKANITAALVRTNTIRGSELINEISDSICGFNLLQNGFLLQHYVYGDEGRIQLVDAKLNFVHNRLSDVENRLLSNASSFASFQELMDDVNFKDLYKDMYDSRVYMDGFYSQLTMLNDAARASRMREFLSNGGNSIPSLIASAINTNKAKVINTRYKSLQIPHIGIGYGGNEYSGLQTPSPLYLQHPSLFIKLKDNCGYHPIDIDDILFIKRTCLSNLSMIGYQYSGVGILIYRKEIAQAYLDMLVLPLLKAINRVPEIMKESINEVPFPPISPYIIHPYVIISYDDYFVFENINNSIAHYQASLLIKDILLNEPSIYNDYLIACAAEVASWAIILKAHIAAAEGL